MACTRAPVTLLEKLSCPSQGSQFSNSVPVVAGKSRSFRISNAIANGAVRSAGSVVSSPIIQKNPFESAKAGTSQPWSVLTEEISVGAFPRSPRDLETLVSSTGINAFVLLETEEGIKKIGLDWDDFQQRVNQQGAVAVRLSLDANNHKDHVEALPETVRAVAALVTLGYKVHISCTNGIHRSPLVALGYLTLVKGLQLTEAWQLITKANPTARPNIEALREVASKQLVKDAFHRGVATDVSLSEAVSKATSTKATRDAFEQLAAYKAKREAENQNASSTKDKLDFYSRQLQTLKEKEEASRKLAVSALKEKEALSQKFQTLVSLGGAKSAPSAAAPIAAASPAVAAPVKDISVELHRLQDQETTAKKDLAKAASKLASLTEKYSGIDVSIADSKEAEYRAEVRLQEAEAELKDIAYQKLDVEALAAKKIELTRKAGEAKLSITAAQDKIQFFHRQLESIKAKEPEAKKAVADAQAVVDKISAEIATLKQSAESVATVAVATPAAIAATGSDVKVREALNNAQDRLEFFNRHLEQQKQKELKEKKKTDEKINAFSQQVSDLKLKLMAADVLALENDKKIGELSEQITEYQIQQKQAAEASKIQNEKIEFFYRHVDGLRKKEAAAKEAATSAIEKARLLDRKVTDLAKQEALAAEEINSLNSKVAALIQMNAELGVELSETKDREGQLLQVLEDGTGVLTKALESDRTIKQLRQDVMAAAKALEAERIRADQLAAELERELIAAGKKPKHYNDVEKVPSSDLEKQLLSQIATTKQTLVASGSSLSVAVEEGQSAQVMMRDLVLGALSMAAVPFTLMSIFNDAQPSNFDVQPLRNEITTVQTLAPEEVLPPKPIVQPASASSFCKQTLSGERSARVEKFCNSLAEIALE